MLYTVDCHFKMKMYIAIALALAVAALAQETFDSEAAKTVMYTKEQYGVSIPCNFEQLWYFVY